MQYNNQGYGSQNMRNDDKILYGDVKNKKTRLVIDETTIYEVDTECENCKRKNDYSHNKTNRK